MHIEHIALWTRRLEELRAFYCEHFGAVSGPKYFNSVKQFESYFISFESGARLEIMSSPQVSKRPTVPEVVPQGLVHLAFSVGSREQVLEMTERLRTAGISVIGEPRTTGDGYFESVVQDPDGNLIEITF